MTLLKLSDLSRADDVELAIAVGAWALGFAVGGQAQCPGAHPDRVISDAAALTPEQAAGLVAVARARDPGVLTVARVLDDDPLAIVDAAVAAGVSAIEVGAGADATAVRAAMRAAGLAQAALIAARDAQGAEEADFVVFPYRDPGLHDGSQPTWDPFTRPAFKRVIVAGDIEAARVGEVVRTIRPVAVDVGRPAQARPGVLAGVRLRQLAAALAEADGRQPRSVPQ